MKSFDCFVVNSKGEKIHVVRSGPALDWVLRDLNAEGFVTIAIDEVGKRTASSGEKLRLKQVIEMTQTLGTLMGNGLTLKETLKVASDVFPNPRQKSLFQRIDAEVSKGRSLCESLETWSTSLPPLYLGLIRVGERTGDLTAVLAQLGEYLQTRKALKDKTGNALVYPAFVLAVATIGLVLLVTTVFPAFTSLVTSLNPTAAASYSASIASFQFTALVALFGFAASATATAIGIWLRKRDPEFRARSDAFFLRLPLLGPYLTTSFGLNFCFALETLLQAGYSIEASLEESVTVITNYHLKEKVRAVRASVLKGMRLSKAFTEARAFPASFVGWVAVGEGAHDLARIFKQLRVYYQQDLDKAHSRFLSLIEPALILVVGLLLVVMVLTFVTPVFTMLGNLL